MAEKSHAKDRRTTSGTDRVIVAAIVIIVVAIWAEAILISGGSGQTFQSFKGAFVSSPNVIVYSVFNNSTSFVATDSCASVLLQKLEESAAIRKNVSTISFYIVNSTRCTGIPTGLGTPHETLTNSTAQSCIALSDKYPSIFLNYSANGNGTVVSGHNLYFYGNQDFLARCGIAFYFS
ncbi:MAG: hypothetical protein KGH98_01220 [Candidatus Micrarchaeota archaeon]|nr:hypothetical protein [Candidatus Micrarchaeota archaeon]